METKLYTSKDLESLSSSELYTKGPDMPSSEMNIPSLNPGYENPGEGLVQVPEKAPELERELYSKPIERQFPSNVGGLENLSASALYSGEPCGDSGFGKDFGVGIGYVYDTLNVDGYDLNLRMRADDDSKIGQHLNDEIIYNKGERSKPILTNNHIPLNWKDGK